MSPFPDHDYSATVHGYGQSQILILILYYSVLLLQAFLEHGIPTTPQMLVAMMPKVSF
jgi:hypothetical protein